MFKVDFHCHTRKIKSGDPPTREVTEDVFCRKIKDTDVKIVAITNHNCFDMEQFREFSNAVGSFCQIWPGIEIDIQNKNGPWHLILISNPETYETFSTIVNQMFEGKEVETQTFTIEDVCNEFKNMDVIYIPHIHKANGISDEDRELLNTCVEKKDRIFYEPANFQSMEVHANHDYKVIMGSDVRDWKSYERCNFGNLRLPVSSFTQFCLLAEKDSQVVNTLLDKKRSIELRASPHTSCSFNLKLYYDVNVIFGQKGTGKSEIVRSLYDSCLTKGLKCVKYIGTENEKRFEGILDTKDIKRNPTLLGSDECCNEFDFLKEWKDKQPESLATYIEWYETKERNENKKRMKIAECGYIPYDSENLKKYEKDCDEIKAAQNIISEIDLESYLTYEEVQVLKESLAKLHNNVKKVLLNELIEIESIEATNKSVKTINRIVSKKTGTQPRPLSTGFIDFALGRFELDRVMNKILTNLLKEEWNDKTYIGTLEGKGKMYVNEKHRMFLDKISRTREFHKGIRILKELRENIDSIMENRFLDVNAFIDTFVKNCETNDIHSVSHFIGISKSVVTEDGTEYTPSSGEMGILLMQKTLDDEADAFFLDEPERGMGNSYIDRIIRPKLSELGMLNKIVIVATHNANIAVRTLPYVSVLRTHLDGDYSTYIGNPFTNNLINIMQNEDHKDWKDESMHTLEGGKEAFYDRKRIYER